MNKNRAYTYQIIIAFIIYTVTYTIVFRQTFIPSDYAAHMMMAERFPEYIGRLTYPMWHMFTWLVLQTGKLSGGMGIQYACALATGLVNVSIYLCIVRILKNGGVKFYSEILGGALCFVTPWYIPWYNEQLYLGQGSPNTWHNPTNMMVKPFTLLGFMLIVEVCSLIQNRQKVERKYYIRMSLIVFLSTLAKASFFQGIVPALGIYIFIHILRDKDKFVPYFKLCISFIPGFLIIVYTFAASFYSGESGDGISIGWLGATSASTSQVLISFVLVLAFPMLYLILNFSRWHKNTAAHLSVLYMLCSWLEGQLIYENGPRRYDGNFGWAAQLAFTVCWVLSSMAFYRDWQNMDLEDSKEKVKNTVLAVVWGVHFLCGLFYVYQLLTIEGKCF